ncbi:N-acetyl-D-glucosamine kinase [Pirellulimonas nuda]|uniref:N-acetyl-D-glucosamine kinase n=1 Tax=Pirellulimonas nuda TaxID=2528009 RepID=A0A518D7W0_9BACT|nr:ROK family protein [Pirellulimonas nuda]QDU87556.1 N-acetyl-D-glucosamine kinase [Pirellulimonas nuda]
MISNDNRVVLTLDAGGTNFAFAAIRAGERIAGPVTLPSAGDNLQQSLANLYEGFERVAALAGGAFSAISFAFPGPADYRQGVIYNVGNLPAYAGGVPLAELLGQRFGVPVHINNDGDLFAFGEAIAGMLPEVNARLESIGAARRFRNLIGLTLGTGFGGGVVLDGKLLAGDNSLSGEVWLMHNGGQPGVNAEEGASIRAVTRAYAAAAPGAPPELTPRDIAEIARGERDGDRSAAREAFAQLGRTVGDAVANLVTVLDGLVVIGGGLSAAHALFLPACLEVVNGRFPSAHGASRRLVQQAYNLEDAPSAEAFYNAANATGASGQLPPYQPITAIGVSRLGANEAVNVGAYAVALGGA